MTLSAKPNAHGRDADRPSEIPPKGWWQVARRTWREAGDDNVGLIAAGVAFYGFLALVPLLGATVLTYGLVIEPAEAAGHIAALTARLPTDAARLLGEQLSDVVRTAEGKKGFGLLLALLLALYGAMKGAGAIVTAINIAYEETETRSFFKLNLLNAGITIGAVLVALALAAAVSTTAALEESAGGALGELGPVAVIMIKVGGWLLAATLASAAIALLYRIAPDRDQAKWRWLTPGSLVALLGVVIGAVGFGWYAAKFGNYNATYGSLGAVVALLTWLWLSAWVLIMGAELNAELERQTERDSTTGPERPLGERNAEMADTVAPGE